VKLRIRQNTLRLRLTRSEVDRLAEVGRVEEATIFSPTKRLRYALATDAKASDLGATFADDLVQVNVPLALAREWAASERVSLQGDAKVEGGEPLRLLVEKDFECLKERVGEDDSDAYPHPKKP